MSLYFSVFSAIFAYFAVKMIYAKFIHSADVGRHGLVRYGSDGEP